MVLGAGALHAWIKSSARDVDLQVTVSEVRPDGHETFVQSGWLRASVRKLDPRKSTLLEPVLSLRRKDAALMPSGRFAKITVPLYYEGHAYRAGSRIRVTIAAPNGDQPVWSFRNTMPSSGKPSVSLAHGAAMPSRLILPVVPGVSVSYTLPANSGLMRRRAAILSASTRRPLLVTVIHLRAARPGASELCRSVVPSRSEKT